MDSKTVGKNITFMRKNKRWTQKELAAKIGVSDKAIGKWESGIGYPDITHLPSLSELFGVGIDFLLNASDINELSLFEAMTEFKEKNDEDEKSIPNKEADDARIVLENDKISPELYDNFDVKKGLRDLMGNGVVAGLTKISTIIGKKKDDNGNTVPCKGELRYRGYDINDIINGFAVRRRFGFEETVYLLLFGELPTEKQMNDFTAELASKRTLPKNFVRDVIMKIPSADAMNTMAKSLLSLAAYDTNAMDLSIDNVLSQSLFVIAVFPLLAVYGYDAYNFMANKQSLVIHYPKKEYSTAENILYMLRPNGEFTENEAFLLDIMLMLHAEHGGGNNSTFTTHVVSSSGTDTYSAITASLCSLKGSKHGGANLKVIKMFEDLKKTVKDTDSDAELSDYISRLLDKKAFDKSGLIYGMGHAVYSLSDPRAEILKVFTKKLAEEKGLEHEYSLYERVEQIAVKQISEKRKIYKGVSANIDFYSGFVYTMLGIPEELLTPIFAVARVSGWSAHRMEELVSAGKIIRPSYIGIAEDRNYIKLEQR